MDETSILHMSDTHLGKRMYQSDERRDDYMRAFDAAIQLAINEGVDAVLHTGDLFDDPKPSIGTVIECSDILRRLSDADIPFYAIVGNHERKRDDQWVDLVKRSSGAVNRLSTEPTMVGDFALYGIDAIRKNQWETTNFNLQQPDDENATRVLAMHELVQPIVQEQRGADYHISEILDRLPFTPEAIALGDYHAHEEVKEDGCRVFYPGPTERTKVNENPGTVLLLKTDGKSRDFTIEKKYLSDVREDTPREFAIRTVEIGENQGIEVVEKQLENLKAKYGDGLSETAVVLELTGSYNEISSSDVYDLMDAYDIPIQNVLDKRARSAVDVDIDVEDLSEDLASIDSLLDSATEDVELDESIEEVADIVSNDSFAKTNIRGRTSEILTEHKNGDDK